MLVTAQLSTQHPTSAAGTQHARFSPYDWNGGSVVRPPSHPPPPKLTRSHLQVGVAGEDFVVVAADRRLATGYNIKTRKIERVLQLAPQTMLACGGCHADVMALYNELTLRATMYRHKHGVDMGTVAAAQLLSNTLYYRRFFPIYALAVVAGLDGEGKGYVAGYVSCFEREGGCVV